MTNDHRPYHELLAAVVNQARADIIAPDGKLNPEEKQTAVAFFRDHPRIPVIPKGYKLLAAVARDAGIDYRLAVRICQARAVKMVTLGSVTLVNEWALQRAAERMERARQ
jgi:hypothetical protein